MAMRLSSFRINNCFGFGDNVEVDLRAEPPLVYVLGRNSSGKTMLLTGLRHLEIDRTPSKHPNFANFRPLDSRPFLMAEFELRDGGLSTTRLVERVARFLVEHLHIPELAIQDDDTLKTLLKDVAGVYGPLLEEAAAKGVIWVWRTQSGGYHYSTSPGGFREADPVLSGAVHPLIADVTVQGKYRYADSEYDFELTPADVNHMLFYQFPRILLFDEGYSLSDDLPQRITPALLEDEQNAITGAFLDHLGREALATFFGSNDPDECRALLSGFRKRVDALCKTVNDYGAGDTQLRSDAPLLDFWLHEKNGLQITPKTDGKKSFYVHLSENTKFLFGYYLHQQVSKIEGDVLLFDEPNRGFHSSSQRFVLNFLRSLASAGNLVIISTHSEYLIDLDLISGIRLMSSDADGYLSIRNHCYSGSKGSGDVLALQPVLDAIGLRYGSNLNLGKKVVVVGGITDLMYLRAFNKIVGTKTRLHIAPGRGDSTMPTLIALLISQGVLFKVLADAGPTKREIQKAYAMGDEYVREIPVPEVFKQRGFDRSGIEDLFTKQDFRTLLELFGHEVDDREFQEVPNSTYMTKRPFKRPLAQVLLDTIEEVQPELSPDTLDAFRDTVDFCKTLPWYLV
jgi:hypothetical protein